MLQSHFDQLSISVKLGETVKYGDLKGVSFCGCVLMQSVWAYWLWWESWIWSEHESHLTPDLLAPVTVMGGGAVEGRARVRTRCEPGLWCLVEDTPRCWSRSLKGGAKLLLFPLRVCSLLSQHWHHSPEGSYTGARGVGAATQCGLGHALGLSWHIRVHTTLHLLPLRVPVIAALALLRCRAGSESALSLHLCPAPWQCQRSP